MISSKDKTLEPETYKVVILGDSGVGKTSIINRYIKNVFQNDVFTTTGGSFFTKMIQYPQYERIVKLDIWDTAGQERYRAINKIYYQKCHGVILVYDITRESSFQLLNTFYNNLVNIVEKNSIVLSVVGNKNDLYMKEEVSDAKGLEFAKKHKASFKLTSALNSNGDLFENMGLELLKKHHNKIEEKNPSSVTLSSTNHKEIHVKENGCGC